MVTSLTDLDLSKLEYPCILEWTNKIVSPDFVGSKVEFTSPRTGTIVEKGQPSGWGDVGHHTKNWYWAGHCWKLAETPYDPLQNGDTDDDI